MIRNELYYTNRINLLRAKDEVVNRAIIMKCYRALRRLGVKVEVKNNEQGSGAEA